MNVLTFIPQSPHSVKLGAAHHGVSVTAPEFLRRTGNFSPPALSTATIACAAALASTRRVTLMAEATDPPPSVPMSWSTRGRLRDLVVYAGWIAGATLLAVAAVDYFAYDFAHADIIEYGERLYTHRDQLKLPRWRAPDRAVMVLAGIAVVTSVAACLLARIPRLARRLVRLAVAATGAVAVVAALVSRYVRTIDLEVDPDTGLGWIDLESPSYLRDLAVQPLAMNFLLVAIPMVTLAGIYTAWRGRVAWRARDALTAVTLALPATIAAGGLATLWAEFGRFTAVGHTAWVDHVPMVRILVLAGGLLGALLVAGARGVAPSRGGALVLLALGIASFLATAAHRHTIATLYPLRDPGAAPLEFTVWRERMPRGQNLPIAESCVPNPDYGEEAFIYLDDHGQPVLRYSYDEPVPLAGDAALDHLRAELGRSEYRSSRVTLIVERRVPMAALGPLFARVPWHPGFAVEVTGAFSQRVPTADGPAITWFVCAIGDLRRDAFVTAHFPPGATWGNVVVDPAFVRRAR